MLPTFRYHPDPLATGSVIASDAQCASCRQSRGFLYGGPMYSKSENDPKVCPWCIANGQAHRVLGAEFTDSDGVGGHGSWDSVPAHVVDEVAFRTPGFYGWQQERWWTHCGDAGLFLGRAGAADVVAYGPVTAEHLRCDLGWDAGSQFDDYLKSLSAEGQPTACLFRCRVCGEVGGYSDFT